MRLAEDRAPGEQLVEGLEYARLGQTRAIEFAPGQVSAKVQGRVPTAYKTELRLPVFAHEQWAGVVASMADQARCSAALLAGELPPSIEDLFAPAGLRLFPADEQELATSCTCDVFRGKDSFTGQAREGGATRWCKHVCCVMYLVAERLAQQPLSIFSLRGLDEQDLLEQLRQQRALASLARGGVGASPVYVQHVASPIDLSSGLDECVRRDGASAYWSGSQPGGRSLADIDFSIQRPEVSHPLLRRLGASPFKESKFPLVGLLATCYDVIGEAAISGELDKQIAAAREDGSAAP
jgi:uncharacterized Zn finger protein